MALAVAAVCLHPGPWPVLHTMAPHARLLTSLPVLFSAACSAPTDAGRAFIEAYAGTRRFLVYE